VTEGKAGLTGLLNLLTFKYAEEQMRRTSLVNIALILAVFALGTTIILADTDWSGAGTGTCSGYTPWETWVGTLHSSAITPYFEGYWGGNTNNYIYGTATYDSGNQRYYVSSGNWAYNTQWVGHWKGYFYEVRDTAYGFWWKSPPDSSSCNGTWWGNKQ
jgi:hypothetical protein